MARDYTKYNVEGLGKNLNKRKLVFTIVKDYVEKNNPSFEDMQKVFPDDIQGGKGFIRKEANVKTPKHFNMREPLKIMNGAHVVVSNQWGENSIKFIEVAIKMGYEIIEVQSLLDKDIDSSLKIEVALTSVRVLIRNSENAPEISDCPYFDLNVESLNLKLVHPIDIDYLTVVTDAIFYDTKHINDIKKITSKYSLVYDYVPQLWISKLNDIKIDSALKYFFDGDTSITTELNKVYKLNEYDLDNFFESDGVHSLEGL